mmetsp:Transcript_42756/g.105406  ORF Transcript_42756/g.105406 Transcript_42756/m.105406 type:complete len:269 (+) Transcript_42756:333-1139(+)
MTLRRAKETAPTGGASRARATTENGTATTATASATATVTATATVSATGSTTGAVTATATATASMTESASVIASASATGSATVTATASGSGSGSALCATAIAMGRVMRKVTRGRSAAVLLLQRRCAGWCVGRGTWARTRRCSSTTRPSTSGSTTSGLMCQARSVRRRARPRRRLLRRPPLRARLAGHRPTSSPARWGAATAARQPRAMAWLCSRGCVPSWRRQGASWWSGTSGCSLLSARWPTRILSSRSCKPRRRRAWPTPPRPSPPP